MIERGLGVKRLEDAGHKPFGSGVVEFARNRDDRLSTLVSRLNTEQLGLRGLDVVGHTAPSPYPAAKRRTPAQPSVGQALRQVPLLAVQKAAEHLGAGRLVRPSATEPAAVSQRRQPVGLISVGARLSTDLRAGLRNPPVNLVHYEAPHGANARPSTGFVRLRDVLELIVADDAQPRCVGVVFLGLLDSLGWFLRRLVARSARLVTRSLVQWHQCGATRAGAHESTTSSRP